MKTLMSICFIFFTGILSAIPPPQYQIASVNGKQITCSNNAIFEAFEIDGNTLKNWQINDILELSSMNVGFSATAPVQTSEGTYVLPPALVLNNVTQNNSRISVWLQAQPQFPSPHVFLIASIDHENQTIELSDTSIWSYLPFDQAKINYWKVGDILMLGTNGFFSVYPNFDFILMNTEIQSVVNVQQQL